MERSSLAAPGSSASTVESLPNHTAPEVEHSEIQAVLQCFDSVISLDNTAPKLDCSVKQ